MDQILVVTGSTSYQVSSDKKNKDYRNRPSPSKSANKRMFSADGLSPSQKKTKKGHRRDIKRDIKRGRRRGRRCVKHE
jgi:hypothetical protein